MRSTCPTCGDRFDAAAFCPADGSRLVGDPAVADRIGQVIGDRYRLLRKVGEGAMGQVFEAEHIYIHKRVALKLLRPQMASDAEAVQRLHREARATSAIGHDNIVQIEDFGAAEDGSVFLAMEWLDGETTEAMIDRDEIDPELALRIASETCAGLAAAHDSGVIHRDLKPANIFWAQRDGRRIAKILDFGIAKLTSGDPHLTRTGTFVGTPYYMAPEQALGGDVDARADIYSLGVILYEMFTGTVPFVADTSLGVLHQHTGKRPIPPRERAPARAITPAVEALILRCMEKQPDDRFGTAIELGAAIDALRESSSPVASQRSSEPQVRPARERAPEVQPYIDDDDDLEIPGRRSPALLFGLLGLLAVGAAVAAYLVIRPSSDDGGTGSPRGAVNEQTVDASAIVASPATDAGSDQTGRRPPDVPGHEPSADAAPAADRWTHRAPAKGFSFTATVSPRPIEPGKEATITITIEPDDARIAKAMADGALVASLSYQHYKTHRNVGEISTDVDSDGALSVTETFAKPGKHHVKLTLSSPGARFETTTFDICVGADPEAPAATLSRICPQLNPKRAAGSHQH